MRRSYRGGGGISPWENFVRGNFGHNSNFGAGPSDTRGKIFVRGKFRHTPNLWFFVDNQLCATLAGPNFEHYQLNREQKKSKAPALGVCMPQAYTAASTRKHCAKRQPFFRSNQAHKHSRQPTSQSQASKINRHDKQTDCRQQRNTTLLPPPRRIHKDPEVPQIAQKKIARKISSSI